MAEFEFSTEDKNVNEHLTNVDAPLRPCAGRPVIRGERTGGPVPGAELSPERSAQLRRALHEINVAEMAVRGSDVIVYPNS